MSGLFAVAVLVMVSGGSPGWFGSPPRIIDMTKKFATAEQCEVAARELQARLPQVQVFCLDGYVP
jgi:hypothetical protein